MNKKYDYGFNVCQKLRELGFRATKTKIALLELLKKNDKPLSVKSIIDIWEGKAPNQTTLYRALADLIKKGVVDRVDFNNSIAYFEYKLDRPHHHHIICSKCGEIEDVSSCLIGNLKNSIIAKKSKKFKKIYSHSVEFFGNCLNCVNK